MLLPIWGVAVDMGVQQKQSKMTQGCLKNSEMKKAGTVAQCGQMNKGENTTL